MDLLQGQLSEGLVNQLSQQLGGADKAQTATAASGIMSTLMGALAKNAATPEGASALANALDRDHDGSILDDVMGMVTGTSQTQNTRAANGAGILGHILGGKQNGAIDMISKMSGLSSNNTGNLMTMLAPIVMGALGKTKKESGLDASGLAGMLTGSVQNVATQRPEMGMIGKFLDQDGDGSIVDDVAGMGMKILGNLFKK